MVSTNSISFSTSGDGDVINITDRVGKIVNESGINDGIVTVFIQGSTGALTTIEFEPGLKKDLPIIMNKLIPKNENYCHNATWHDGNGYAHLRHALIGPSVTVPFREKELMLGTWQQIVFLEFDNTARDRKVILQIVGGTI